ncbi:MAG TPA: sigma-54 dependent transcriptional regulator [Longimicrobiales bacterium]|nr:sigma-54 dependent transcriptional regulator [Longimicrobiales bacterium]
MTGRILVVDDDRVFRLSTAALLEGEGHRVTGAADASEATACLARDRFDLVILDLRMPGLDGIGLAEVLRTRGEGVPILMISGFGTVDAAVRALHGGVDDFLTKPVEPEVLLGRVADLLRRRPAAGGDAREAPLGGMVGRSDVMDDLYREIRQVAGSNATVLLTGETGTGKERAARAIHDLSDRSREAFVPVNCAALAEGVLESELFGHLRGAFTGAVEDRPGLIRSAQGGTLFLDEIGDVSPAVQQRLLRVLQEREVVPLGGTRPTPVDIRLVAATHRDLRNRVREGAFREDLFFRLNVFHIHVPPLRERRSDIPLLVDHALRQLGGDGTTGVSPLAMRALLGHPWPGNVRQLLSALESARIRAGGGPIQAHHLPEEIRNRGDAIGSGDGDDRYRQRGDDASEKDRILEALARADGVRVRAAELLGMGRTTLWRKMRDYGIDAPE